MCSCQRHHDATARCTCVCGHPTGPLSLRVRPFTLTEDRTPALDFSSDERRTLARFAGHPDAFAEAS